VIPEKPFNFDTVADGFNFATFATALIMSAWGGVVGFLYRCRRKYVKFCWLDFFIEVSSSMFAGVTVFILSIGLLNASPMVAAAFSGIAGHAGARTIILLTRIFFKRGESLIGGKSK
jgi:LydA holin phage, holin superfamily III